MFKKYRSSERKNKHTFQKIASALTQTLVLLFGFSALFSPFAAHADIPATIGYQGLLKNSSGTVLSGAYSFTFRIYSSSTGGVPMWSETQTGITVSNGIFAARLGSVTPFPTALDFNQPLFISTEVAIDGEMSPRITINSVPYAYTAGGVNALPSAPVSATGGRMFYDTADGSLQYFDSLSSTWQLLGVSTGTFQSVTNNGNVTTNAIQFAGGTSTGNFVFSGSVTSTSIYATNANFANLSATGINSGTLGNSGVTLNLSGFGTVTGTLSADRVALLTTLSNPFTLQEALDFYNSNDVLDGGIITEGAASGTIDVSGGQGFIRVSATDNGSNSILTSWATTTGILITPFHTWLHVYAYYNGGSPTVVVTATDFSTNYQYTHLADVNNGGTGDADISDRRILHRDTRGRLGSFLAANAGHVVSSGCEPSATGTRQLAISACVSWNGINEVDTPIFNASGMMAVSYRDGTGGYVDLDGQTQWDNLNFDNGSGVLAAVGAGEFGVHWVYIHEDGTTSREVHLIYGRASYATVADAEAATPPTTFPEEFNDGKHVFLISKLIFAQGGTSPQEFMDYRPFLINNGSGSTAGGGGGATDHNGLQGLQGGAPGQFYHLSASGFNAAGELHFSSNAGGLFTLQNNAATDTKITINNTGAGTASLDILEGDLQLAGTSRITNAGFGFLTGLNVTGTLNVTGATSLAGLTFTIATGTSVTSTNLFATNAQVTNLIAANGTTTNLYISNGGFVDMTGGNVTATNAFVSNAQFTTATIANDIVTNGTFSNLTFGDGTSTSWFGFTTASGTTLNALTGAFTSLASQNVSFTGGFSGPGVSIGTANLGGAIFLDTTSTSVTTTNLFATNARIGTLTITGSASTSFSNLYWVSATGTNTTSTFLSVLNAARLPSNTLINSTSVCLSDGTNCPSGASPNFQTVTNSGNTTTRDIQFGGGTSTKAFTIQNNFTVTGTTSLSGLSFLDGTSSNWLGFATASGTNLLVQSTLLVGTTTLDTNNNYLEQVEANVNGPRGVKVANYSTGTAASAVIRFFNDDGLAGSIFAASSNFTTFPNATSSFGIAAQGSERLRISTNGGDMRFTTLASDPNPDLFIVGAGSYRGNIGIGTQNPTSKLTVIGGMFASDIQITNSTSSNATTSIMYVSTLARLPVDTQINNVSVCLLDGTNCPSGTTPNFQTVTNTGNTTTKDIQFGGGTSTRMFTVQNNLTVTGTTALQALTFTNATGVYLDFSTSTAMPAALEGRLYYDNTQKALAYISGNDTVGIDVGRQMFLYVRNLTGSTITKGQVVRVTGDDGSGIPTVDLAKADAVATVSAAGLANENILNGAEGKIIINGSLINIDTSAFAAGDVLYVSAATSGALTNVRPISPNITLQMALVTNSNALNGSVVVNFITPKFGAITTGAVTFGDTNNFITDDATKFFWDNTLKRLGIGTSSPSSTLHVVGSTQLQTLLFTEATGTSATTTNFFATNGTVSNLFSSGVTLTGGTINGVTIGLTSPSLAIFSNATSTNLVSTSATSTNFAVLTSARLPSNTLINNTAVCLLDGTNCPSGTSPTFQTVTNTGNTTTKDIQFGGGTSTGAFTVQSNFTVTGSSTLNNVTIANATATAVTTTDLYATSGFFASLFLTNGTSTSWFGFTTASGTTMNASGSSIDHLTARDIVAVSATTTNVTSTNLFASTAALTNLSATAVSSSGLIWNNATGTNATTTNFFATLANISSLFMTNGTSTSWFGFTTASGTTMNVTNAFANGFTWTNATGTNTTSTLLYATSLRASAARVEGTLTMAAAPQQALSAWASSTIPATGIESVRSLQAYDGYLYAGQGDSSGDGDIQICDPTGGGSATLCDNAADWSTSLNQPTGVTKASAMMEYNSILYAGFSSTSNAGISYCNPSTSGNAAKCDSGDWAISTSTSATEIRGFSFYNGFLYATYDTTVVGSASVLACNPAGGGNTQICDNTADWSIVALPVAATYEEAPALVVYLDRLYALVGNTNGSDNDLFVCDPTGGGNAEMCDVAADWTRVLNNTSAGIASFESGAVYNGMLYLGTGNAAGSGGTLVRCDPTGAGNVTLCDSTSDTSTVMAAGGTFTRIPALMSFDGVLIVGREGTAAGDGKILEFRESYTTTTDAGFGAFEATYAFANYNGVLYAGRGNSTGDGQVWYYRRNRNISNAIQFETASSTGSLWFSQESLSTLGNGQPGDVTAGAFKFSHGIITEAGAYDLAEMYPTAEAGLEAGDVVAMSKTASGAVERANGPYDPRAIGVISTKPGFLLSSTYKEGVIPVALAGRVPVKFSAENGSVQVGDALTAASTTGYAMKATESGVMIGRALQSFGSADVSSTDPTASGTIMMVVQTGYYISTNGSSNIGPLDPGMASGTSMLQGAAGTPEVGLPQGSRISQGLGVVTLVARDATFTGNVTVLGPISLRGQVILGSSNAGRVEIAPRTDRIAVQFPTPFLMTPHVFISFQVQDRSEGLGYDPALWNGEYFLTDVTTTGFGVRFPHGGYCPTLDPCPIGLNMDWFTVGFEGDEQTSSTAATSTVPVEDSVTTSTDTTTTTTDQIPPPLIVPVADPSSATDTTITDTTATTDTAPIVDTTTTLP